jgi:hypothetical protein
MTTRHTDSSQYRSAKLALRDRIDCDKRLTPWTRLVGGQIIKRSWEDIGCTDSEAYFVKVLGASPATVKSAIKALREKGYIRVEKRGRSNQYFLIFEQGQNLALSQRVASEASASRGQGGTGPIGLKNDADRAEKQPPKG